MGSLQGDLTRAKQEYENQQSERTRIAYVLLILSLLHVLTVIVTG
jgi:hypothetical protein